MAGKAPPFPHSPLDSTASSGRRRHIGNVCTLTQVGKHREIPACALRKYKTVEYSRVQENTVEYIRVHQSVEECCRVEWWFPLPSVTLLSLHPSLVEILHCNLLKRRATSLSPSVLHSLTPSLPHSLTPSIHRSWLILSISFSPFKLPPTLFLLLTKGL